MFRVIVAMQKRANTINRPLWSEVFSIILFISLAPIPSRAQNENSLLAPKVDKRVELISIIYRLAKGKENLDNLNPVYSNSIDTYFKSYSNHPTVKKVRSLIDSLGKSQVDPIGWELPSLAVHLTDVPELKPSVPYNDTAMIDGWGDRSLLTPDWVESVQQFYNDANCEAFFKSKEHYYQLVNKHYQKVGAKVDFTWAKEFTGLAPSESYFPIISLCLRRGNYIRVNIRGNFRNTYTLFECTEFTSEGIPSTFSNPMFARLLLHEHMHTFGNQLVDANKSTLQRSGKALLAKPEVWSKFKETFYNNWEFLWYESIVRALCIQYMLANPEYGDGQKEIDAQKKGGFFWMGDLVNELSRYRKNREGYKDLQSFMPDIILLLERIASEKK